MERFIDTHGRPTLSWTEIEEAGIGGGEGKRGERLGGKDGGGDCGWGVKQIDEGKREK